MAARRSLDRRSTRLAEIVLIAIAILGVAYLGDQVIGSSVFASKHRITVQLESGGGIYPGADVTYRGTSVGRVKDVELADGGVRVTLDVKGDVDIPADSDVAVSNLSAIGEQRIDFRPRSDDGPFLRSGSVVATKDTTVPRRFDQLITHLGDVADRIDPDDLTTITTELGQGLDTDTDLVTIGRNANRTVTMLQRLRPSFSELVRSSRVPMRTIVDTGDDLRSFAHDVDLVAARLEKADGTLRSTLDSTDELMPLLARSLQSLTEPITGTVASWNEFAKLGDDRLEGYAHWLRWAPDQFHAMSDATRDGSGHVLLVANFGDNCQYGEPRSNPFATSHVPAAPDNRCTVKDPHVQQRGAQYAPRLPGDPEP